MIGIVIFTVTALVLGVILVIVDEKFGAADRTDEITKLLPGYNCGSCGHAGCKNLTDAILVNPEMYKKCRFLKDEALEKIEEYLKSM